MIPLHEQLRLRRSELYMTQRGLGKKIGLTGAGVSFRERGDGGSFKALEDWVQALHCELRLITEGSSVICKNCREQVHEECPGGTWCDCAHRPTAMAPYQIAAIGHPGAGTTTLAAKVAEEEDLRQAKIRAGARLLLRLSELVPETTNEVNYHTTLRESLDLLYQEGLREAIEQRYAADELAREGQELSLP